MTSPAKHVHHGIDYVEIAVTEVATAKAFYGSAFGWTFTDYGPDYAGIQDGREGGAEAGGLRRESAIATGDMLVILYSRELEKTRDAVKRAGGAITKDIFSFPGGRRFEFTDPSGNQLGVWSDGSSP